MASAARRQVSGPRPTTAGLSLRGAGADSLTVRAAV